ncbi:MAG: hypothetical protein AAB575_02150 [Patescibacteria group bacterium]
MSYAKKRIMLEEKLAKKQTRIRKQQKKRFAKNSGTLSGQFARTKIARGYSGRHKTRVKIEI